MLSYGMKRYHLEPMLSSGTTCYHLGRNIIIWDAMLSSGANVIIWDKMLSSGANVLMVSSGANVIIWCYHVMLSSGMITHPFFVFPGNFTHSYNRYISTDDNINHQCLRGQKKELVALIKKKLKFSSYIRKFIKEQLQNQNEEAVTSFI
jgi:hypothetical protein